MVWLNTYSALRTLVVLPVSIPLGAVSLAEVSVSGVATVLTSKYQTKLSKVTKMVDITTLTTAVFEMNVSKAFNNGEINKREFGILQALHLKIVNELANVDHKMESENRAQLQKSLLEEINEIKKTLRTRDTS